MSDQPLTPTEQSVMSREVLFRLLNEAREIGRLEARPLRSSADHVSELGAKARWDQLLSDAWSTLRGCHS